MEKLDFQQADILIQSATKRKNDQLLKERIREKEFMLRKDLIQNYFLRMSNINKKKMIIKFLDQVGTLENVLHIMNFMFHVSKIPTLSSMDYDTNCIQDKQIFDHNRMLDEAVLEQTINEDLEWFDTIDGHNQVALIVELLRRAGGNIRRGLYVPLLKKYQQTLGKIKIDPTTYDVPIRRESIRKSMKPEHENYDPTHPSSIEVVKQRKKWDVMISKYKSEVEKVEKKLRNEPEKPKEEKASKKGSKASKKPSTKASKKSKKSDKAKDKKDEVLDWIQLLPVWIVKKICGYLDQKTLKILKKVSDYYSYVVGDLLKDMKMRKKLDSAIQKLQADIDPVKLEAIETGLSCSKAPYKLPKYVTKDEIGVTAEKLVPKKLKKFVQKSVLTEAAIENEDFAPYELETFPRVIKEDMLLYKYQPCFLRDVNLTLGVRDDTEMNSSFGTYSLPSLSSTLTFSVDDLTLSEW